MIVKHPTLANVEYDVPDADVKRWKRAGWLVDEQVPDKPAKRAEKKADPA